MRRMFMLMLVCWGVLLMGCAPSSEEATREATPLVLVEEASPTPEMQTSVVAVSPTPETPVTASPTPTVGMPPELSGACRLVVDADTTVYMRPSTEADVFGLLTAGETVELVARTADEWVAFEPGVAQAANVGVFRYRWVRLGETAHVEGNCETLPEVWAPRADGCYLMVILETPVYAEPRDDAPLLITLVPEMVAAVVGWNADRTWAQVDLSDGTVGVSGAGWVQADTLNLNGPCDTLPVVEE
ncbi:SH3 domain-containing protein [Ardenticatena maritima]|nr:SH3 domain-containing protein [Ardenticatena maritima]KPL85712.1 hypothetical protein SE16_15135 [Ardenticatena maritima]